MERYIVVHGNNEFVREVQNKQSWGYLPYGAPLLVGNQFVQMMASPKESKILLLTSLVGLGSNFPSPSARSALMAESIDHVVRELTGVA